jgi:TP901 family phage tail tape measure protein
MAQRNVVREDIVRLLFEGSGFEEILQGESAMDKLRASAGSTGEALDSAGASADVLGGSMMDVYAKSELFGKLADAGKSVLNALMDCTNAAADFETSLAKLATIADTSEKSLGSLTDEILSLSNETGVSAESLTESAYQAISAGVDTASAVEFVAQANELAVGGFTDTSTAVDVLSTAINAYGLEVSDAGKLSDYLITTQNLGKTSVDELAQSVGKVIPIASAYGVKMDNLSSAYAVLTAGGIATAEAGTYLKAMLNELGDSGSTVGKTLVEETGQSFSQLEAQGYSLGDVMNVLGESVGGDAGAFNELWSSSEAGVGALSLLNAGTEKYNGVLNEMQSSTGAASEAYETMTGTAQYAQEQLSNSFNNLKIAIGNSLLDTFADLNSAGADVLGWITEFVQEHESLVAGLTTGIAVAAALTIGVAAIGVAYTAATVAATAFNAATGDIIKIIGTAAVVLGAAVWAISDYFSYGEEAVEDYDGTLEECRNEITLTEKALYKAKARYGENSDAVKELESDLDTLNKQYEKGGGYLGELTEKANAAIDKINELNDSVSKQYDELDSMQTSGFQAVSMLEALSEKSVKTNSDLDLMQSYADYLNDTFNCNIVVDYDTGELTGFDPSAVVDEIQSQTQANRIQISMDYVSNPEYIDEYTELYNQLLAAQDNYHKATITKEKEADALYDEYLNKKGTALEDAAYQKYQQKLDEIAAAKSTVDDIQEAFDEADDAFKEHCDTIDDTGATYELLSESMKNGTSEAKDFCNTLSDTEDALESADSVIEDYKAQLDRLAENYDEVYQSAYECFHGQFGLFDEASTQSEEYLNATVENAQKALDSQVAYWETYSQNINTLKEVSAADLGVEQENYEVFMSYIQSGTEEAAGLAASMASYIEDGNTEALTDLVNTYAEVDRQQQAAASSVADWVTDFSGQMTTLVSEAQDAIDQLELEDEASTAAYNTISAYANTILSGTSLVVSAVSSVTASATAALAAGVGSGAATVQGNASGTTDSDDIFIAGEKGPELIVGKQGSTVFPTSETNKIIDAVSENSDFSGGYSPESNTVYSSSSVTNVAPIFNLTLNGDTSSSNRKKTKRWIKEAFEDAISSAQRLNPSAYVI